ncbi:hypothetical protein BKA70DRAFT_1183696 [Coprinopsis sp. MPI-PUGE-AT-0042]|nr:hypothetical protein BKA70DRAFT_1183696 [Coprinopsis sp. MPI-PUGE-AT-0042]
MHLPPANRKFTDDEKRQLVANLDIEVAHRCRQFEAWLQDRLENFTIHQEGQVSRIPKQVRSMTMREFGEKYNGNIQLALRGFQKERLEAAGVGPDFGEIEKSMRKRKHLTNTDTEKDSGTETDSRPAKNVKTAPASPVKPKKLSTQPANSRFASSSKTPIAGPSRIHGRAVGTFTPEKRAPFSNATGAYNPRPAPSRPTSPLKPPATARVPSSSSFNPMLPPKAPVFPTPAQSEEALTQMRLPRKDENMLSINGSPIANPYQFGLGWFKGVEMNGDDNDDGSSAAATEGGSTGAAATRGLKRSKSSIVIRRNPSVAFSALHSRVPSQASGFASSSSSQATDESSRPITPADEPSLQPGGSFRFPARPPDGTEATPRPIKHTRTFSAMVAIPTKDGHMLEFDPLQTSPGALDALEGITQSAKKQARMEMGRLVQAAVDKWKL